MEPPEIITVDENTVGCDGGEMGHPKVYLNLDANGQIDCPYCGRRFVRRGAQEGAASTS
jgi:uncharacterized Zn-finger protein